MNPRRRSPEGPGTFPASEKAAAPVDDRSATRSVLLIVTLCGAQVVEVLGVTVVIVALPVIGTDLGLAGGSLQLVVSLYAVLYGGLLLTAGRIADNLGRRPVLAVGLIVTCVGTLACATATTGVVLLAGRAVQGVGGALVTPAALALLTTAFPSGRPRRRAISAWTAAAAGGGALGFGAGGLLVDLLGWRSVFWLLTVVAGLVLVMMWRVVPAARQGAARRGFDPAGTFTVVSGLVLVVVGTGSIESPELVPVPPGAVLVAGMVLLGGFLLTQRHGRDPLIGWAVLTHRHFLRANGVAFVNTATTSASGTLVALVATDTFGLSSTATGLVLLPFSAMVVVGSLAGGFWLRRPEQLGMAAGLAVVAVSMSAMAAATATRSLPALAVAVALAGLGLSWAAVTSTSAASAALPATQQGVAAGAVNTAAQVGTALGVAVLITVASLAGGPGHDVRGYATAFVVAAALSGAVAVGLLVRRRTRAG